MFLLKVNPIFVLLLYKRCRTETTLQRFDDVEICTVPLDGDNDVKMLSLNFQVADAKKTPEIAGRSVPE